MIANYTDNVLYLDRIIAGHAVRDLIDLNVPVTGKDLYTEWLVNETMHNTN